jgi:hypothetical protein
VGDGTNDVATDVTAVRCSPSKPEGRGRLNYKHKKAAFNVVTEKMKANLLHQSFCLTETEINAGQYMLKQQHSYIQGLEDTLLGPCGSFSVATSPFVQILHTGTHHWICVSNIEDGSSVQVYDSLYTGLSDSTKKQIASKVLSPIRYHFDLNMDFQVLAVPLESNVNN